MACRSRSPRFPSKPYYRHGVKPNPLPPGNVRPDSPYICCRKGRHNRLSTASIPLPSLTHVGVENLPAPSRFYSKTNFLPEVAAAPGPSNLRCTQIYILPRRVCQMGKTKSSTRQTNRRLESSQCHSRATQKSVSTRGGNSCLGRDNGCEGRSSMVVQ